MNVNVVKLGRYSVGRGYVPLIVAEMSGNHNGSLARALEIVDRAATAGAHAVKLQTYTAATMTLPLSTGEFFISDPQNPWTGQSLYDLYDAAHTPWEWHAPIFERCRHHGLIAFSSPFDISAVEYLETLDVPCYKIASFENIDIALIKAAAATGKPLIISTGMASVEEIGEAVSAARGAGCKALVLLKCTSSYPADAADSNLLTIPHLAKLFDCPVGLSDHTMGIGAALTSIALGAVLIEKHVTLDRADGGVDSEFSLDMNELAALVRESLTGWRALGKVSYGPSSEEMRSLQYRRSLYIVEDMRAGEAFTVKNLRAIRPGAGLPPKFMNIALGRAVRKPVKRGTPLSWHLIGP